MNMKHGGDILSYSEQYSADLLDFSSNINPLGFPKGLKEHWMNTLGNVQKYPDIKYRHLKENIANYLKCDSEEVLLGNGVVEIIDSVMRLKDRVHLVYPSFGEYLDRALIHGKTVESSLYNADYSINIETLKAKLSENTILFLGNPNNPSGLRVEKKILLEIYNLVLDRDCILVLDEAFYEFCPEDYDSIELFRTNDFKNVVILRAATKFFALPGLRFGYGCTGREMCDFLESTRLPWSISYFADSSGEYIFNQKEYIEISKKYIKKERNFLLTELSRFKGIHVFPTDSNFILIQLLSHSEEEVFHFFLKHGILVRTCSSFQGLDFPCIRIAIRREDENKKLLTVFQQLLEK